MNPLDSFKKGIQIAAAAALMSGSPEAFSKENDIEKPSPKFSQGIGEVFDSAEKKTDEQIAIYVKTAGGDEKWFWGKGGTNDVNFLGDEKRLEKIFSMGPSHIEFIHSHPQQNKTNEDDAPHMPPSLADIRSAALMGEGIKEYGKKQGREIGVSFGAADSRDLWRYSVPREKAKEIVQHYFNTVGPLVEYLERADPRLAKTIYTPQNLDHLSWVTEKTDLSGALLDYPGLEKMLRKNREFLEKNPGVKSLKKLQTTDESYRLDEYKPEVRERILGEYVDGMRKSGINMERIPRKIFQR